MAAFRSSAARAALLAAVVLLACCSLPAPARAQNPPKLNPRHIVPNATSGRRTLFFQMRVTLGRGAPDCISREVILVNGLFQPTIEARTNDTVVVSGAAGHTPCHSAVAWRRLLPVTASSNCMQATAMQHLRCSKQ